MIGWLVAGWKYVWGGEQEHAEGEEELDDLEKGSGSTVPYERRVNDPAFLREVEIRIEHYHKMYDEMKRLHDALLQRPEEGDPDHALLEGLTLQERLEMKQELPLTLREMRSRISAYETTYRRVRAKHAELMERGGMVSDPSVRALQSQEQNLDDLIESCIPGDTSTASTSVSDFVPDPDDDNGVARGGVDAQGRGRSSSGSSSSSYSGSYTYSYSYSSSSSSGSSVDSNASGEERREL